MVKSSVLAASALMALCAANIATADDSKPAAVNDAAHRTCMHYTGSRLIMKPDQCSASPGRSYSQQDIDRTGHSTVAGALRNMDPSLTISR
jgi:hypothetical protein